MTLKAKGHSQIYFKFVITLTLLSKFDGMCLYLAQYLILDSRLHQMSQNTETIRYDNQTRL